MAQIMMAFFFDEVENTVGKGENAAWLKASPCSLTMFSKLSFIMVV